MSDAMSDAERRLVRLIRSTWAAIDRKDWDRYAAAFSDQGTFTIMGQTRTGREAIADGPARDLSRYEVLQHLVMNEIVEIDGDRARGQWYAVAIHVPAAADPAAHADVGLRYEFEAAREADGWRFTAVELFPLWTSGLSFAIEDAPDRT
jgi:hypothetical protein